MVRQGTHLPKTACQNEEVLSVMPELVTMSVSHVGRNLALQSHKPYLFPATLFHLCEALQQNTEDKSWRSL